jgi:hypothetical protein
MLAQLPAASRLYALAADRDQGRLIVDSVAGFASRTPELAGALAIDAWRVTAPRSGSMLEVLAADAPGAFGLRPAFLVVDELAQWADADGPRRLFDATTSALAKVPDARCLVISSAGDPAHWSYKVLEHARRDPLWRTSETAGPAPWTDPTRLGEQRRRLLPSVYARLFENQWTEAEGRLTTLADVRACVGHAGDLARASGSSYVTSLDVGLTNDRTAAVVAHAEERPAGLTVVVDRLGVWHGGQSSPVELSAVEAWVEEACRTYGAQLVFDPFQAAHLAQRLKARRVQVAPFTFSQASVGRLAVTMFGLLRDHCLDLPNDEALIDELAAVRLRETAPGVVRMDHSASGHDDRVIATAMAASHLLEQPFNVPTGTGATYRPDAVRLGRGGGRLARTYGGHVERGLAGRFSYRRGEAVTGRSPGRGHRALEEQ